MAGTTRRGCAQKDRIQRLEEKIAWLEGQCDEQGQEISALQRELSELKQNFRMLWQKVGDPYATRDEKDEVPPPHY